MDDRPAYQCRAPQSVIQEIVDANHILARHRIVDAFGHVSADDFSAERAWALWKHEVDGTE